MLEYKPLHVGIKTNKNKIAKQYNCLFEKTLFIN